MNKLIKKKIHSTELIWQIDLLNMSFWEAPILKTLQVASQLIKSQSQRPMELAPPSVISCLTLPSSSSATLTLLWVKVSRMTCMLLPQGLCTCCLLCLQILGPEHIWRSAPSISYGYHFLLQCLGCSPWGRWESDMTE